MNKPRHNPSKKILKKYEGKTFENLCPTTKPKKNKERLTIASCTCKDCGNFRAQNPESQKKESLEEISKRGNTTRNTIFALIAAGAIATLGLINTPKESEETSKEPQKNHKTEDYSPEEIHQKVSEELKEKAKKIDEVIAFIEEDLLQNLEKIKSSNPELQQIISELIDLIKINLNSKLKNGYQLSKIRWDKRDPSKVLKQHKNGKEKIVQSANMWTKLLLEQYAWKIPAPYVIYTFLPEGSSDIASYTYPDSNISLKSNNDHQSLVSKALLIHEMIHVLQHKKLIDNPDKKAYENFKSHLYISGEQSTGGERLEALYIHDMESEAYAACLEIADLMSEGRLSKYTREDFRKNEQTTDFFNQIFKGCSKELKESFMKISKDYFSAGPTRYPQDKERLENHGLNTSNKGLTLVSSDELKKQSRRERAQQMKKK